MSKATFQELLDAGVHFGHQKKENGTQQWHRTSLMRRKVSTLSI